MQKTATQQPDNSGALYGEVWSHGEELRNRLARRLHDDVCGQLIGSLMDLALIRNSLPPQSSELSAKLQRSTDVLGLAVKATRELVEQLRPSLLDNVGLFAALKWHTVESCRVAGVTCNARLPIDEPNYAPDVSLHLFRLAEEALLMLMQQPVERIELYAAEAAPMNLTLTAVGRMPHVQDDAANASRLALMKIRADLAGATLDVSRPEGGGMAVTILAKAA